MPNLGNLPLIRWLARKISTVPSVRAHAPWLTNLGNLPLIAWTRGNASLPLSPAAHWLVNAGNLALIRWRAGQGGAPAGISVAGAKGLARCSGSITAALTFGSHAGGVVECSGSVHAVISALATAKGIVQCGGTVGVGSGAKYDSFGHVILAVTIYATCQGLVECDGFATTPLKGTSTSCLQPSSTPVVPVQGNACY